MLAVSCQVCFHTAPFMDPTGKLDPSVFQAIRSQVEMLSWNSTFADVYTDLVSAATWPWATCSLLETQIPLFSLFSKLTQCLGCIHEEAFPLILPKYPLPLYPITVISIDSILPFFFFGMTFSVFSDILSIFKEWSSRSHWPRHSIHGYFSLNK